MTGASLLGPLPGTRVLNAQQSLVDALTDVPTGVQGLPGLVQLPARGPYASSVARTAALLTEMPVELGTHGWKLADHPGLDLERTHSLVREDLDALAVAAHGWTGRLVVPLRGPWTMAAILWLARGDRVLGDHGAVRDLAHSLADGAAALLASLRTAVPGAEPVVVLREPMLHDVLAGTVPTFSGHGRLRSVTADDAEQRLRLVVEALRAAGAAEVVCHAGSRFASRAFDVLTRTGAEAVGVSATSLASAQWERIAATVEAGTRIWFGLPGEKLSRRAEPRAVADRIAGPWRAVGLPAAGLRDAVVHVETSTSVSGTDLVLADRRDVKPALRAVVDVATELAERAEAG